ncbi:amino acid/amide ABC transporter membrane protein 2 (HAAT family) /amino acid/amide ABC transporter ATP-binding protein 1 (HAAT family) [Stackebrandtia endophytica]|uniref:Amino acid/amide ABC transporter membrane protein 2 (HAAT family) /amino acid/amide ABC transporter ATP-binding protein 1 (HAAT family) n=1 Tax=Stackebrandtia endophytica TaxID=1496996 RepID=A0A543AQ17_9ACTN|nr:branched-chain amino acid ABC transporter ATP-binding protein/permease [Stackebrandtia endophytica]TQL74693.1 amino acid/amide ABC transporter membrane protein 2 (HAAT family) /amino acid/amide ABC transporter ATP-binding protein 1 (HAAT family) [Stackebrandtia endophytica]
MLEGFGYDTLITTLALTGIFAYSFHVVLMAGQLSLGQAGFASLGAFVSTLVVPADPLFGSLSPVLVGIPVGMAVGAAAAFLLGLPVLRLRGVFLAIATIAFGEGVRIVLTNSEWSGGAAGLRLDKWVNPDFAVLVLLILVYAFWRLRPTRAGRAFAALREDELAASSMGINVARTRMISFVASGAIAGLYGVLLAYFIRRILPGDFDFSMMLNGLIVAVVGGFLVFFGPVLGSGFLTLVPEAQRAAGLEAGWVHPFITSALLLLVILFLPGGLSSLLTHITRRRRPRLPAGATQAQHVDLSHLPSPGTELVSVNGLSKDYGGVHAVRSVDLTVDAGEVLGIIGPNGSGKTTLVNMLSGLIDPTGGAGNVLGEKLGSGKGAHRFAKAGISRTFQHSKLFERLSVLENALVGTHVRSKSTFLRRLIWLPSARRDEHAAIGWAMAALERVGLADRAHLSAAELSYGDQRRLEIARALASNPALLILDEPAAGMNHVEATELSELITSLASDGITVMLIEHNVGMVLNTCTRLVVLNFGEVIAAGEPTTVAADPAVIEAYLGTEQTGSAHV